MTIFTPRPQWIVDLINELAGSAGGVWGSITGTLSNQTDLQTALNGKANSTHTHVIGDVTNLQTSLDNKLDDSQLDTDTTLAANSDTKIASQKAVKAYVDANAPLLELVGSYTFTGSESSYTFSSIPTDKTTLIIEFYGRSQRAAQAASVVGFRCNGDTANNYAYQRFDSNLTTNAGDGNVTQSMACRIGIPAANAPANEMGIFRIAILGYRSSFRKILTGNGSYRIGSTNSGLYVSIHSGVWENTAAITSLTLVDINAANLVSGSTVNLYAQ